MEGAVVTSGALKRSRARQTAQHVASGRHPFARLVECRQSSGWEAVVVDLEVQVSQHPVHDIRPNETIALVFGAEEIAPEALALTPDFPPVPHLILGEPGAPPMLCLYDAPWPEARLTWTPIGFVERVREWLAMTARGALHADDQPLEPLMLPTRYVLVLPADFFATGREEFGLSRLSVTAVPSSDVRVLVARSSVDGPDPEGIEFVLAGLRCRPQQHGVVRRAPRDLRELHELLTAAGTDLLGDLRRRLAASASDLRAMGARLLVAVAMPKTRNGGDEVEAEDVGVFLTGSTAAEVGVALGCLDRDPGSGAMSRLLRPDLERRGEGLQIELVTPVLAFDRRCAARAAGFRAPDERRVVCVGGGALGSQVAVNLAREGFGRWTPVDGDHLLPHNLERHAAYGSAVGKGKAEALSLLLGSLFGDEPAPEPIQADVLRPGEARARLETAFAEADLIVDTSASVAVARHLARDVISPARRISLFLSPSGNDLVLLAEDAARSITLDALEMQYHRAVASLLELEGHLASPAGRIRYARACRDVSAVIPQSRVGALAGIGAAALRRAVDDEAATIAVWRLRDDLGVDAVHVEVSGIVVERDGDWQVSTDEGLLDLLRERRAGRLPNETGGVLLGSFDAQRRIVHVVEAVPSPADSLEWPTLYIRGAAGLAGEVQRVHAATLGQLRYIGEWHSHPDGCGCRPSTDDRVALAWLAEHMAAEGLPAVMAIVGENGHRFLLGSVEGDGDE